MRPLPYIRISLTTLLYVLAYIAADKLALGFEIERGISLWYPPAGLTLGLLLLLGSRWVPLAFAAGLISGLVVYPFSSPWGNVVTAAAVAGSYGLVSVLLRRIFGSPPQLETMPRAFGFAFVLLVISLPTACVGSIALRAAGVPGINELGPAVFRWWLGDTAGILALLPALLVFAPGWLGHSPRPRSTRMRWSARDWLEAGGQAAAIGATLVALYLVPQLRESQLPYLSFVPLTWIVLRHGLPGAALAILAINVGTICVLKTSGAREAILVPFLFFQFATAAMGLALGAIVTSRKRAEVERNRLLQILEATPDYIGIKSPEGRVLYGNAAFRRLHEGRDVAGLPIASFHPPWAAEKILREAIPAALQHGRWTGELALLDAKGKEIPVSQEIVRHSETVDGQPTLFAVGRDISEQKRAEADRLDRERQMLASQKLESLGVLAGGIAHDFNNIFAGILGYASLARLDLPESSPVQQSLKEVESATLRAAELCQQMLAYAGKGQFEMSDVDLSALVQATMHLLQVSLPKKVQLTLELAPNLPSVRADPSQLRQVLMNLVLNAGEAVGDRPGSVRLATGAMRADTEWLAASAVTPPPPPGDYVYLEVVDDGRGMSAETRARIFEPFFTTKFTGHGLGLSAALGIVRSHGGTLHVYSELEQGARIRIAFPAQQAVPVTPAAAPRDAQDWRGHGTILVVDDEETVRIVTARVLEHSGFTVEMATNGSEAVERFALDPLRYRAVVLDMLMPVMDGEQALEELRRLRADLPVLLMSGYSGREGIVRDSSAPTHFLAKPFQVGTLLNALRDLIEPGR